MEIINPPGRFKCRLGDSFRSPDVKDVCFVTSYSFLDKRILEKPNPGSVTIENDEDTDTDSQTISFSREVGGTEKYFKGKVARDSKLSCVFIWDPVRSEFVIERAPYVVCHPVDTLRLPTIRSTSSVQESSAGGQHKIKVISKDKEPEPKRQRTQSSLSALPHSHPPPPVAKPLAPQIKAVRLPTALPDLGVSQIVPAAYIEASSSESEDETTSDSDSE